MNSLRQELMLAAAIETLQEGENLLAPTDLEREFEDHLKVIYAITFMFGAFLFPSILLSLSKFVSTLFNLIMPVTFAATKATSRKVYFCS
jgi:hypothetical protein